MSQSTGKYVALGLGVILVGAFVWSQRPHAPELARAAGSERLPVATTEIRSRVIPARVEVLGSLRSRRHATLSSAWTGAVRAVHADAGAVVVAGEVLVELASEELAARAAGASAQLVVAERALEEAERELGRTQSLFDREARSQQELDAAGTLRDAALARRDAAREALTASRAGLEHARIVAPFDGVVLQRFVDPGDLSTPGRALLELHDPSALRLEVRVPERLLARIELGAELSVTLDSVLDAEGRPQQLQGRVEEIAPSVDTMTRTALVKLALPGGTTATTGLFGRAWIETAPGAGLAIPASALVVRGQLELVFALSKDGQKAELHVVRSGRVLEDGQVEIVSGLEAGTRVVSEGAERLHDGSPVHDAQAAR